MAAEIQVGINIQKLQSDKRIFDAIVTDMVTSVMRAERTLASASPLAALGASVDRLTQEYRDLTSAIDAASAAAAKIKMPSVTSWVKGLRATSEMTAALGSSDTLAALGALASSLATLSQSYRDVASAARDASASAARVSRVRPPGAGGAGAAPGSSVAPGTGAPVDTRVAGVLREITQETLGAIRAGKEQLAVNEKLILVGSQWYRVSSDMSEQAKLLKRAYESSQTPAQKSALLMERLSLEMSDATRETYQFRAAQEALNKQLQDRTMREAANRSRSLSMLFDELKGSLASRIPGGSFVLNLHSRIKELNDVTDDATGSGWRMAEAYARAGSSVSQTAASASTAAPRLASLLGTGGIGGLRGVALAATGALGVMGAALGSVVAVGAGAAFAAKDYSAALVKLKLVSQASDKEMQMFRDTIASLAATGRIVPEDAANGLQDLVSLGFSASEAIQLLPVAMNLATAAGLQLGESASIVGATLKGFGLDTKDAAGAADMLVGASNATAIQFGDLTQAVAKMSKGAVVAEQDLASMLTAIGLARNSAVPIEVAATGVNSALTAMATTGRKHIEAMLGGSNALMDASTGKFKKFEDILVELAPKLAQLDSVARGEALTKMFGTEGLTAVAPILAQMTNGIKNANGELVKGAEFVASIRTQLEATGGTTEKFASEQMGTLNGQLEKTSNLFTTLISTIGDSFSPVVTFALTKMNQMLEVAVNFTRQIMQGGPSEPPKQARIRLNELIVQREEVSRKMREASASDRLTLEALAAQYQTLTKNIDDLRGTMATPAPVVEAVAVAAKVAKGPKPKTAAELKKEASDAKRDAEKAAADRERWEQMYQDRLEAQDRYLRDAAFNLLPEYRQKLAEIAEQQYQLNQALSRGYMSALDASDATLRLEQERVKVLQESVSWKYRSVDTSQGDLSKQIEQQLQLSQSLKDTQQNASETAQYSGGLFQRLFQLSRNLITAPMDAEKTLNEFGASFAAEWQAIMKQTGANMKNVMSSITGSVMGAVSMVSQLSQQLLGVDLLDTIVKYGNAAGRVIESKLTGPNLSRIFNRYIEGTISLVSSILSGPVLAGITDSIVSALDTITRLAPKVIPEALVSLATGLTRALPVLLPALFEGAAAIVTGIASALEDPRVSGALGMALGDAFVWLATNGVSILARVAIALVESIGIALANLLRGLLASLLDAVGLKSQAAKVAPVATSTTTATRVSDAYVAPSGPRVLQMSSGDAASVYQQGGANDPARIGKMQLEAQWANVDEVRRLRQEIQGLRADLRGARGPVVTQGVRV